MKFKVLVLAVLSICQIQAQKVKKPLAKKTVATAVKKTMPTVLNEGMFATILTSKGSIVLQLEYQKTPVTVANFVALAEGKNTITTNEKLKGKPFYDGLKFHRVIADFMIQGGDPSGNGSGGPGYAFKDEFTDLKFDKGGILAMANSGPTTNGSQFFITHKETPWLNNKHTIFGHVVNGMDIVNKIAQDDVILKVTVTRKGTLANTFDASKIFATYYANKDEDAKKQAAIKAAADAEAKKAYFDKYATQITTKASEIATLKTTGTTTASGLIYKIIQKGSDIKPADGTKVNIHYAGYFEDGFLFDSNYEAVAKAYGKFDENRLKQNGYNPFPFEVGSKTGMIPGFLEGIGQLNFGDKAFVFIPANLAYGAAGAGGVIPPNANLIFEIEMLEIKAETKP